MDRQAKDIKKEVPGVKVQRVGEGIEVEFNSTVLFAFDRANLSSGSEKSLNDLTAVLKKYPDTDIEIKGHTDNKGGTDYNITLSEKRATAVAAYLKDKGIAVSRITTKGFGESAPEYSNDTEAGRAQNRRVAFLIAANEKIKADARKEAESNRK